MDIDRWGRESERERRRARRRGRQRKRSRERERERRRDGDKELIRFPLPSRRLISYSSLCPLSFFVCDFYFRLVCLFVRSFVRSSVRSFVAFFFRRPFRLLFASRFPPRAVRTTGPPPSPRALSRKVSVGVCGRDREEAAAW